jgi:oxygen-independent coproporphyrinogen-3 oxidase
MINALRLRKGFTLKQFSLHTGLSKDVLSSGIDEAVKKGLLVKYDDTISATDKGFGFLSDIQLMFS